MYRSSAAVVEPPRAPSTIAGAESHRSSGTGTRSSGCHRVLQARKVSLSNLGPDDAEARVGVSQHQHGIGPDGGHQLVTAGDDVAHSLTKVIANCLHINIWIGQFQVLKEHAIQVIVVVLPRMRQQRVEVLPAFINHCRQPDYLRPRPYDDEKL